MKAKILKNMTVEGRLLQFGDIIDVGGWKHAKSLNRNRYIQIIEEETPEAVVIAVEEKPKAKKAVASKE